MTQTPGWSPIATFFDERLARLDTQLKKESR